MRDSVVQVVVGIVTLDQSILISKRHDHVHQGGLWEFPGGKIEAGETEYEALCRELLEEVDIRVQSAEKYFNHSHQYSDKHVELCIWSVTNFEGDARGVEGQEIKWINISELDRYPFPAANQIILERLISAPT